MITYSLNFCAERCFVAQPAYTDASLRLNLTLRAKRRLVAQLALVDTSPRLIRCTTTDYRRIIASCPTLRAKQHFVEQPTLTDASLLW